MRSPRYTLDEQPEEVSIEASSMLTIPVRYTPSARYILDELSVQGERKWHDDDKHHRGTAWDTLIRALHAHIPTAPHGSLRARKGVMREQARAEQVGDVKRDPEVMNVGAGTTTSNGTKSCRIQVVFAPAKVQSQAFASGKDDRMNVREVTTRMTPKGQKILLGENVDIEGTRRTPLTFRVVTYSGNDDEGLQISLHGTTALEFEERATWYNNEDIRQAQKSIEVR
ncbi:hypothetical protein BGW80DRAFT_1250655 [Lactifluus volemus]|nr:hypothetical protein BGW80DRAFT_1250655 [Lactifluus volemus]